MIGVIDITNPNQPPFTPATGLERYLDAEAVFSACFTRYTALMEGVVGGLPTLLVALLVAVALWYWLGRASSYESVSNSRGFIKREVSYGV